MRRLSGQLISRRRFLELNGVAMVASSLPGVTAAASIYAGAPHISITAQPTGAGLDYVLEAVSPTDGPTRIRKVQVFAPELDRPEIFSVDLPGHRTRFRHAAHLADIEDSGLTVVATLNDGSHITQRRKRISAG